MTTGRLMMLLWVVGLAFWCWFISAGTFVFDHNDWPKEFIYYSALQDGWQQGVVPWSIEPRIQRSRLLLAIPEVTLAPWSILLRFMGPGAFVLANQLICYTIGHLGVWWWVRRFAVPAPLAAVAWMAWCLNGHLLAHLAVGHSMWSGAMLMPWFLAGFAAFALKEDDRAGSMLIMAMGLAAMLLLGALHVVVGCTLLLVCWSLINWRSSWRLWPLPLLVGALAAARLLTTVVAYPVEYPPMFDGFPNPLVMGWAVALPMPYEPQLAPNGYPGRLEQGIWEYTTYTGVAALLVTIASWVLLMREKRHQTAGLGLAVMIVALFSIGVLYIVVSGLNVPLLAALRIPSRLLVFAVLGALFFGVPLLAGRFTERSQRWLWLLVAIAAAELLTNATGWRPQVLAAIDAEVPFVMRHDPLLTGEAPLAYRVAFGVGVLVSVASWAVAGWWVWRAARKQTQASE